MKRTLRLLTAGIVATFATAWQVQAQIAVFPYAEDFESTNTCTGSCNSPCSFTNGWLNDNTDSGEWITDEGGTSSSSTGPSVDYNPGTSSGNYVYFETSSPCYPNVTAHLWSPSLDLSGVGGLNMVFAWHMWGSSMGTLSVDASSDGGVTWVNNVWTRSGDNGDVWTSDTVSLTAYAGFNDVRIRFRGTSTTSFTSDMAIDDVLFYQPLGLDAGVTDFPSPGLPSCNLTNSLVEATVTNFGINDLTSVDVEWTVNGVPQTPVSWSGTLPNNMDTTLQLSGSYTFIDGDILKAWTTNANGVGDSTGGAGNDTLEITIQSGLMGTYTIGAGGDYNTFNDAANALMTFGVCGDVIFDVMDGTYTEQISLMDIQGVGPTATVTWRSQNMDPALVTLTYGATGTADNWVIQLAGADYMRFEDMTIASTGVTYGTAINVQGGSSFNDFSGLVVNGDQNVSTTSTNMALVTSFTGDIDSFNTFVGNTFRYGSYVFYWYGVNTTTLEKGTEIRDNDMTDFYYRGIHSYYHEDINYSGNTIMPGPNYTGSIYRMYMYYNNGTCQINGNHIGGMKYGYGIYMSNCTAPANARAYMSNNMFSVGDSASTSTSYGMYFTTANNWNIANNSVYLWSNGTSSRSIYMTGGGGNNVFNNIFRNDGPGYGAYVLGGVGMWDYNVFYTPDPSARVGYFGSDQNTFMDWQTTTGWDMMGGYGDPMFVSFDDLHTCADSLVGSMGMMDSMITMDFDDQMRNNPPDIGADEILDLSNFSLGADSVWKCSTDAVTLGGMEPQDDGTYIWSTNENTPTISASNAGTYSVLVTTACGTAFVEVEVIDIPDAVANFSFASSFFTAVFTDMSTGADSWMWDFGDGNTSTMQNPIHVYGAAGTYTVTLTVTGPCGTDTYTSTFIATSVGMSEADMGFSLNLFPNPNNGEFDINIELDEAQDVAFSLLDLAGKEVWTARPGVINGMYNQHVSLDAEANGVYMLRIKVGEYTSTRKVILQK